MRVEQQSPRSIVMRIDRTEAARLLEALHQQAQVLGAEAIALEQALRAAGVRELSGPDHPRFEYMPPLDE